MCVCVSEELKGGGVGGQVQGERREEVPEGAQWQGACIFSRPRLNPSSLRGPLRPGPPGDTDGQHVEGKRRGYDLLPCGEKSTGRASVMRPKLNKSGGECDPDLQPMPRQCCFN